MEKTVCFTGHRHIPQEETAALWNALVHTVENEIRNGARIFRTGGALGFDTMAAKCVLLFKETYPDIRLELILPCPTQAEGWSTKDALVYQEILAQADSHRYLSDHYYTGLLQMRNRALVENADLCIAYLKQSRGGTAYTVSLALRAGIRLINLGDPL